jgi:antitoxin ParD1/3/4
VVREVGRRGIAETELEADDFSVLLARREFKDLVVGELYEAYFLPERHEFDWQLLKEIVAIITSEPVKEFIALSVFSGVIGNVAFLAFRAVLAQTVSEMKNAKLGAGRQQPFHDMKHDIDGIEKFFQRRECARIAEVETSTGIPREKLRPLLKLLGFTHHRRKFACNWCRPGAAAPGAVVDATVRLRRPKSPLEAAMNVSLTAELEKLVNAKVQSGRYTSASEVVREALRLLEEHDLARAAQLGEFNKELGRRLAALDRGEHVSPSDALARLQRKSGERRKKHADL